MIFMKNSFRILLPALAMTLMLSGCKKFQGDVTVPAFIHIDAIDVVRQSQNAPSGEEGFYVSEVDAVELVCYFEGDEAETALGAYQLPCTVPVLRHGEMKYLKINAAVKQNGISGTRIAYPFYQTIMLEHVPLTAEDTTYLGEQTDKGWTLHANYYEKGNRLRVLAECFFEPTSFSLCTDTNVEWVVNDPQHACTGQGYGRVHVADSVQILNFGFNDSTEFDPGNSRILYLEMNYKTDVPMYVQMLGFATSTAGALTSKSVMCLYPTDRWRKIYINLGRTWSQFNYLAPIKLYFQAANTDGVEGDILLDNIKVLTTN